MPRRTRADLTPEERSLVLAARRTGALDALLGTAGTPREVAEATGLTPRSARVLVTCMADLGFLERVGEVYEPTDRALGFLAKRDVRSIGRIPHEIDLLEALVALPETMRSGEPPARPPDRTTNRLGADAATADAVVAACVDAALAAAPEAGTALQVCGGSGVHAAALAERGLDVTLQDDPEVIDRVAGIRSEVSHEDRSLATIPAEFDLTLLVDLLWGCPTPEARELVGVASETLTAGGTLVVLEPLRNRSDAAVSTAVRALATGTGECHASEAVSAWLREGGLADVTVEDVPGTPYQAVLGHREVD